MAAESLPGHPEGRWKISDENCLGYAAGFLERRSGLSDAGGMAEYGGGRAQRSEPGLRPGGGGDRRSAGKVRLHPGKTSLPDGKGEPGYHSLFLPFRRQLCDPVPSVERLPLCAVAQPGYGSHLCDGAVHGRAAERDCRVSGLPDRGSLPSVRRQRAGFFFRPVLRNL